MDYETRITKVETLVETIREELDRLHADIADLRAQTDKNFKETADVCRSKRQRTTRAYRSE